MNIQPKNDYSFLFRGLSSGGGAGGINLNFLSDYYSIKNGSYGKLLKAYYSKTSGEDETSSGKADPFKQSTMKDSAKELADIEKKADNMKESADALLEKGTDSVFKEKQITSTDAEGNTTTDRGYDKEAVYSAVSDFVDNYNALLKSASTSNTSAIEKRAANMVNQTKVYESRLADMGITVDSNHNLSIDKEKFMNADESTVKSLFNTTGSYAYSISAQASLIDYAASNEASKSSFYDLKGKYQNNFMAGGLFNGYM